MIETEWQTLQHRFPQIKLHEYIVMPNHFHAIIEVGAALVVAQMTPSYANTRQPQGIAPTIEINRKTIGDIIGAFKSITTVEYIRGIKTSHWQDFGSKLWQRNYWEHVIRNEQSLNDIAQYIINNPRNWQMDKLRPKETTKT